MTLEELIKKTEKWNDKHFPKRTRLEQLGRIEDIYKMYLNLIDLKMASKLKAELFIACIGARKFKSMIAEYFITRLTVLADIEEVKRLHKDVLEKIGESGHE